MLCFNYVYNTDGALITERQRPSRLNSHKTQISGRDTQIAPFFFVSQFRLLRILFCFVLLFFAYLIMLIIKTRNKSKTTNKSDSLLGLFAKFRGNRFSRAAFFNRDDYFEFYLCFVSVIIDKK